uniref:Odorant receptor n=1 Tax=Yemma signatus TaxID=300820 RepID=A0A385H686_9HEMI|nr:odorant receptor [Yemma signatus]
MNLIKKGEIPTGGTDEDIFFNPRGSRRFLKFLCCLDYFEGPAPLKFLNKIYICIVYTLQLIVILQGLIHSIKDSKVAIKVEAVHYTLCIIIITCYISNELYNHSSLTEAWKIMKYTYNNLNGPDIPEDLKKIHRQNSKMVKNMNIVFSGLMFFSSAGYLSFAPIREAIYEDKNAPRTLPIPMYFPFDVTKNPGYTWAVIWEGLTLFYLCGVATSANQSYSAYMGTLRAELALLNHSIIHIEERAAKKFGRNEITLETYKDFNFQKCLNECLKEDIRHHYNLLKYYNLTKSYLGFILLVFIVVASIILAAAGYLISRPNSPMDETVKFVIIVCAEMNFVLQLCWYGEQVSHESSELFRNLFRSPWYQSKRTFRDSVDMMLCGTMRPMQLKTTFFNIDASLATYNSVITTSFQYFNILRNIQSL